MEDAVKEDSGGLGEDRKRPDAVIVGDLGERFDYAVLNGLRLVLAGAELIALQKNRYWQRADGLALDVGGAVAAGAQRRAGAHRKVRRRASRDERHRADRDRGLDRRPAPARRSWASACRYFTSHCAAGIACRCPELGPRASPSRATSRRTGRSGHTVRAGVSVRTDGRCPVGSMSVEARACAPVVCSSHATG